MKKIKNKIYLYPQKITENFDGANFHIKYCLSFIKKYLKGNILEVGAGCGSFTRHYFSEKFSSITMTERDKKNALDLSKKYKKIKNIKDLKNLSKKEKIKETIKALKQGYELIYGGWLESGKWSGELDFLEINKDLKSNLGSWSYEVIDTKNSASVKGAHIYQVGLYSFLLKEIQGKLPKNFYILLKDKTKQAIKLREVYDTFLLHKNSYENFITNELNKTKPEKCGFCSLCDWNEICSNEWIKKRHLNQVLGNNKKNTKKLNKVGINNYDDLAKLDPKKK